MGKQDFKEDNWVVITEEKTELNFSETRCVKQMQLLLSLQMFFSSIQTSVLDNLFPFKSGSLSIQRDWEIEYCVP